MACAKPKFKQLQDISTDVLVGRDTAATGVMEEISVGGGVEFSGSGGIQRSALTGKITAAAGSGATAVGTLTAADIPIVDAGGIITGTHLEDATQENRTAIDAIENNTITGGGGITSTGTVGADDQSIAADVDGTSIGVAEGTGAQLGVIDGGIDTLQMALDSVDETIIDFGSGANQVDATSLPTGDTWGGTATDTDAALEELRDSITASSDPAIIAPLTAVATTNIALTGTGTVVVDGVTVVTGDRVGAFGQTTALDRKVYIVAAGAWTEATEFTTGTDVAGVLIPVSGEGTMYGGSTFIVDNAIGLGVVGTDTLVFKNIMGTPDDVTLERAADGDVQRAALTGVIAASAGSNTTTVGTLTAADIPIVDAGSIITATDLEGATQENRTAIDDLENNTITGGGGITSTGTVGADDQSIVADVDGTSIGIAEGTGAQLGVIDGGIDTLQLAASAVTNAKVDANADIAISKLADKFLAGWVQVNSFTTSTSDRDDVNTAVTGAASVDTARTDFTTATGVGVDASSAFGAGSGSVPLPAQVTEQGLVDSTGLVTLRDSTTKNPIDDGAGNEVYGVLYFNTSDSLYYIRYFSDVSGTQTAYSFTGATTIDMQFEEIFILDTLPGHSILAPNSGWMDLASTADITAVNAGNGLTGGGTSGSVTLSALQDTTVNTADGAAVTIVSAGLSIDGDIVNIDQNPTNYTPSAAGTGADVDDLASHLQGIDDELGTLLNATDGPDPADLYWNPTAGAANQQDTGHTMTGTPVGPVQTTWNGLEVPTFASITATNCGVWWSGDNGVSARALDGVQNGDKLFVNALEMFDAAGAEITDVVSNWYQQQTVN